MIQLLVICGTVVVVAYLIFKSKCSEIDCWGAHVVRAVEVEAREHEFDVEHGVPEIPNIKSIVT